jgi:Transglutaminase-like superfamily
LTLRLGAEMNFWGEPILIDTHVTNPVDNDWSTRDTIRRMIAISHVCSNNIEIKRIVDRLIRKLPASATELDLVRSIYWWTKNHIKFREDESILGEQMGYGDVNQELLISPIALIQMPEPQGDCDDFSMMLATLCLASKIPVWFITVAVDETQPNRWSHVYCMVMVDGERMPLDASHGTCPGWETQRQMFRRQEWFVG